MNGEATLTETGWCAAFTCARTALMMQSIEGLKNVATSCLISPSAHETEGHDNRYEPLKFELTMSNVEVLVVVPCASKSNKLGLHIASELQLCGGVEPPHDCVDVFDEI